MFFQIILMPFTVIKPIANKFMPAITRRVLILYCVIFIDQSQLPAR